MKLSQHDIERLRSWKEGQCVAPDPGRPHDRQHLEPMLPRVAFAIVSHHLHKAKTARGKLRRCIRACRLVLDVLEGREL